MRTTTRRQFRRESLDETISHGEFIMKASAGRLEVQVEREAGNKRQNKRYGVEENKYRVTQPSAEGIRLVTPSTQSQSYLSQIR